MSQYIKIGTTWYHKTTYNIYNTKKEMLNKYIKIGSTWKPIYSYSWKTTSNWNTCSQECNTGTQDMIKKCYRSDGIVKPNYYCEQANVPLTVASGISIVNYKSTDSQARLRRNCKIQNCSYTYYLSADVDDYGTLYLKYSPSADWTKVISKQKMWNGHAHRTTGGSGSCNSCRGLAAYGFTVSEYKTKPIYFKFVAENSGGKSLVAFRMCKAYHDIAYYQDGCGTPKDASIANANCTTLEVATGYGSGCGGGSGTFGFKWTPSSMVFEKVRCCGGHCTAGVRKGFSSVVNCDGEPW